jgi:hypothetical protein
MDGPLKKIESHGRTVWVTQPKQINEDLLKRRECAFNVAINKLAEHHKVETFMQTAEAFGRGLFAELITDRPEQWTIENWVKPAVEHIFNPMGIAATFTKITDTEAQSMIFQCPTTDLGEEACNSCPFSYGFVRGLFRSAFPDGEVIMKTTMMQGAPMCTFTFKRHPTAEDRRERERIKKVFTHLKKEEK